MISEVLFKEMLNENYSRRAIDLVLLTTVNSDWDGNIHLSTPTMADGCNSKTRYVNKLINRFQKFLGTKAPINRVCEKADGQYALKLNYGKIDKYLPYNPSERYLKTFNLFFDEDFIKADVVTKRLILVACFEYSFKKFPTTKLSFSNLKKEFYSLQFLTKQQLNKSISYIAESNLTKYFVASVSDLKSPGDSEVISFEFNDFVKDDYIKNTTIYKVIRDAAIESGYHFELSDDICKGIAKQMGYIRNVLYYTLKNDTTINYLKYDDLKPVIKNFIKYSLFGMFKSLSNNFETAQDVLGLGLSEAELEEQFGEKALEISNGNKAAAYLSGVFKTLLQEESAKVAFQIAQIDTLHTKSSPVLHSLQDVFVNQLNPHNNELESNFQALTRTSYETISEMFERANVLEDLIRLFSAVLLSMPDNDISKPEKTFSERLPKLSNPKSISELKKSTLETTDKILQNIQNIKANTLNILSSNIIASRSKLQHDSLLSTAYTILNDFFCCTDEKRLLRFYNKLV